MEFDINNKKKFEKFTNNINEHIKHAERSQL